jgi:Spy/CpxP family protein refolding chaperone
MKRTIRLVGFVCVMALVFSVSGMGLAQLRLPGRPPPPLTRDELVERFGITRRQAGNVIKVHERHSAKIEKVEERFRQQTEDLRKSESQALAKIVNEDQMREIERFLQRRRRPMGLGWGRPQEPPGGAGADEPSGPGLPFAGWRERLNRLRNLTPEQKERLEALMESYREQLRKVQEKLRKGLQEILTSEQMERFRARLEGKRPPEPSRPGED